ncbi:MAG TPA: D-TA family PLP-dependent enzyme [Limnochordia bacterium]
MHIDEVETPAVAIDLDLVEQNLRRWQAYCDQHGIANRPHIKTHKIVELARRQIELGAVGITCQKLGEAEVMADAGLNDIFLPYNIVGDAKLARLVALARRVRLRVSCDDIAVARGLSRAAAAAGLTLEVLVECDTGLGRCGVQSPAAAADLAGQIARLPGLAFAGLMTYPTGEGSNAFMAEARRLIEARGLAVPVISGGGTPQMWQAHTAPAFTEHRAGTYIYHDRYTVQRGAATFADCALRVLATVVSRPTPARAVLDAGSKALTSDLLGLAGHGTVVGFPDAHIARLSEEHGVVEFPKECPWQIGQRVAIIPNHACVVSNLFDRVFACRGDEVEAVWPVAARGRVQ